MGTLGPGEIVLIMALALLFFGPKKLPEIGKSVGNALREFRRASNDFMDAINNPHYDQEEESRAAKSIEYPGSQELSSPENYEALPYGSDFYPTETAGEEPATAAYAGASDYNNPSDYYGDAPYGAVPYEPYEEAAAPANGTDEGTAAGSAPEPAATGGAGEGRSERIS